MIISVKARSEVDWAIVIGFCKEVALCCDLPGVVDPKYLVSEYLRSIGKSEFSEIVDALGNAYNEANR